MLFSLHYRLLASSLTLILINHLQFTYATQASTTQYLPASEVHYQPHLHLPNPVMMESSLMNHNNGVSTPKCNDIFNRLPTEIALQILEDTHTFADLHATITASPYLLAVFLDYQIIILYIHLERLLDEETLNDLFAAASIHNDYFDLVMNYGIQRHIHV